MVPREMDKSSFSPKGPAIDILLWGESLNIAVLKSVKVFNVAAFKIKLWSKKD